MIVGGNAEVPHWARRVVSIPHQRRMPRLLWGEDSLQAEEGRTVYQEGLRVYHQAAVEPRLYRLVKCLFQRHLGLTAF